MEENLGEHLKTKQGSAVTFKNLATIAELVRKNASDNRLQTSIEVEYHQASHVNGVSSYRTLMIGSDDLISVLRNEVKRCSRGKKNTNIHGVQTDIYEIKNQQVQKFINDKGDEKILENLNNSDFDLLNNNLLNHEGCLHWFHIHGSNPDSLHILGEHLGLSDEIRSQTMNPAKIRLLATQCGVAVNLYQLARMGGENDARLVTRRLSIFYSRQYNTVVTISGGRDQDPWDDVRVQLSDAGSFLQMSLDGGNLVYFLLDAVVDNTESLLDSYGDVMEGLEFVMTDAAPTLDHFKFSHALKADIWQMQRWGWQMGTMASDLKEDPWENFTTESKEILPRINNQCQVFEQIATAYLEKNKSLQAYYEAAQGEITNAILYYLTLFTFAMIPPQFFTGVYGMNFDTELGNMPELLNPHGYEILWYFFGGWWLFILVIITLPNLKRYLCDAKPTVIHGI